jgi:hypothetical protein
MVFAASRRPARSEPEAATAEGDLLAIDRAGAADRVRHLAARSPELAAAVERFFQAGGERCLASGLDLAGRGSWRSHLASLAEREDAGTIAVLGAEAGLREWLLDLAAKRPDLFLVFESAAAPAPAAGRQPPAGEGRVDRFALHLLRENVAIASGAPGTAGEERAAEIGRLLGYLEAATFREEEPFASSRLEPPSWLAAADRAAIESWRFQEGLRRSVDWGTRWVVFGPHHPLIWRAVEREVAAFLHRLVQRRVIVPDEDGRAFEVACAPSPGADEPGAEKGAARAGGRKRAAPRASEAPRVEVRVRARWRGAAGVREGT